MKHIQIKVKMYAFTFEFTFMGKKYRETVKASSQHMAEGMIVGTNLKLISKVPA